MKAFSFVLGFAFGAITMFCVWHFMCKDTEIDPLWRYNQGYQDGWLESTELQHGKL